jgi:hypothetical protein
MHIINTENIHKYLQQQKSSKIIKQKSSKYWRLPKILAYTQNIGAFSFPNIGGFPKYRRISKI